MICIPNCENNIQDHKIFDFRMKPQQPLDLETDALPRHNCNSKNQIKMSNQQMCVPGGLERAR